MSVSPNDQIFNMAGAPPVNVPDQALIPTANQGVGTAGMVIGGVVSNVSTVNGLPIGAVAGNLLTVWVAQLRLPADGGLRKSYNHKEDPEFDALMESIRQTGGINVVPMIVEVTPDPEDVIEIDGETRPMLTIRAGQRRFYALSELGSDEALVFALPIDANERAKVLISLIDSEMKVPLAVLDRASVVAMLVDVYRMNQSTVAKLAGMSQPTASRLYRLDSQPRRIKSYIANGSLKWEQFDDLNRRFKDDEDTRALVAWLIVQEGGGDIDRIANMIAPPMGNPTHRLAQVSGAVTLQPLGIEPPPPPSPETEQPKPAQGGSIKLPMPPPEKTYWQLGFPQWAVPTRIMEHHHEVTVRGTRSQPEARKDRLHVLELLNTYKRAEYIPTAMIEEAYLADLQAIREGVLSLPFGESQEE